MLIRICDTFSFLVVFVIIIFAIFNDRVFARLFYKLYRLATILHYVNSSPWSQNRFFSWKDGKKAQTFPSQSSLPMPEGEGFFFFFFFVTVDPKYLARRFEFVVDFFLFCSVLFCSVLFCSVLFCSVLFCSVLSCPVLFCSVLFCSVLSCSVLFCSVLFCSVLFCSVLFCFVLFCFVFIGLKVVRSIIYALRKKISQI